MVEGAFSFRGRIGRLDYFLAHVMEGLVGVVGFILLILLLLPTLAGPARTVTMVGGVGLFALGLLWFNLSLQVRRIRDIGWDPVVVLVGWVALGFADVILAHLVPSWAVSSHRTGTPLGGLVNIALALTLLVWPGRRGAAG